MSTLLILLTFLAFIFFIISVAALLITALRKKDTVNKWKKRTIASTIALVVLFAVTMQNTPKPEQATAPAQESTQQAQPAQQAAPASPEDAIKQTAESNNKGLNVKGVEIAKNDDGTYSVIVMLEAGESASDRAALESWKRAALAEQKALYTSEQGKSLQKVIVQVYADFKGKDGQTNNNVAYWASVEKDKAAGIDWSSVKDIDKVAQTYLHPSLRKSLNK